MNKIEVNTKTSCIKDILKLYAIFVMTLDHLSAIFLEHNTMAYMTCQFLGNSTFTIMAFSLVQGFRYTHSLKKYAWRLLLAAVASQLPYMIVNGMHLNIMFSLLVCLGLLYIIERFGLLCGVVLYILYMPASLLFDWYFMAPAFVIIFKLSENSRKLLLLGITVNAIMYFVWKGFSLYSLFSVLLPGLLLWLSYDYLQMKSKNIVPRNLFYVYYPLHLCVLAILKYIIL